MKFNRHSNLEGMHAFLGASKYHWINYSDEKVAEAYKNFLAAQRGTEIHEFAATCIRLKQKLPRIRKTLNMYYHVHIFNASLFLKNMVDKYYIIQTIASELLTLFLLTMGFLESMI